MKTLELFAGTGSFSKVMKKHGHETFTIDNDPRFNTDKVFNLLHLFRQENVLNVIEDIDIVWMSPPCTAFSLASGNTHFNKDKSPKTKTGKEGIKLLKFCEKVANKCIEHNKIFFIENPNGRAVWFLPDKWLKRVWYCQYGDTRAKPTNIWTNLDITFKTCKNNNPNCSHIRAKRGSKTGTQGLKGSVERSVIPPLLFEHILQRINELGGKK